MIKANELTFVKIEDEKAPHFSCNACGKILPGKGMLMADIKLSTDSHFSVTVCNETCERNFKNHKNVDEYLRNRYNTMRKLHRNWAIKQMGKR